MNKQDAESLLANTFSDEFTQALLDAIEDGISCYINRGNGLAFLTDWMRTTIEPRVFGASVLSAIERADWSHFDIACQQEKHSSSRRIALKKNDGSVLIDLLPYGREFVSKYAKERCNLNQPRGTAGKRYIVISYQVDAEKNLIQVVAQVPRKDTTTIASMFLFGQEDS